MRLRFEIGVGARLLTILSVHARAVGPGEEADNPDIVDLVVHVLREGIEKVRSAKKGGDPLMRLEKYLICVVRASLSSLSPHSLAPNAPR